MTVRIPLTRGMYALVDDDDTGSVSQFRWHAAKGGRGGWYARRGVRRGDKWVTESMHRFLTGWPYVDHRNGDGLDNRRDNLRPATDVQNNRNQTKTQGKSRYKGVSWIRRSKSRPWHAKIRVDYKSQHLGYFATEEEAGRAYDAAARRLFGEFAAVNFPQPGERSALLAGPEATGDQPQPEQTVARAPKAGRAATCSWGHPTNETNTRVDRRGRRECRPCRTRRQRELRARRRAQTEPAVAA